MTALIVLRLGLRQTLERGVARIGGTMAGALLATLLVLLMQQSQWSLAGGAILCTWAAFSLLQVNYVFFTIALTSYVVFLLSLAGLAKEPLVIHRIVFTALGGGIALTVRWLSSRIPSSLFRSLTEEEIRCSRREDAARDSTT